MPRYWLTCHFNSRTGNSAILPGQSRLIIQSRDRMGDAAKHVAQSWKLGAYAGEQETDFCPIARPASPPVIWVRISCSGG
jgi:hypothetical protein